MRRSLPRAARRAWCSGRATSRRRIPKTNGFPCDRCSAGRTFSPAFSAHCPDRLMRLAFLTHEPFYQPSGGGSAEAVYLVEEMVARGWEVHVFCPRVQDPEAVRTRFKVQLHQFTQWEMGRYTKLRNLKYLLY